MHIRIDPVAGDAPVRLLRVESIQSRRRDPSDEREERRQEERGASYAPTPAAEEPETYAPPAEPVVQVPVEPAQLDAGIAALTARPPLAPPPVTAPAVPEPAPARDVEEESLYPSGTPAWMTALLKAR